MLLAVTLSVITLRVPLNVNMCVILLRVVTLCVIVLNVFTLITNMMSVFMQNVVYLECHYT